MRTTNISLEWNVKENCKKSCFHGKEGNRCVERLMINSNVR